MPLNTAPTKTNAHSLIAHIAANLEQMHQLALRHQTDIEHAASDGEACAILDSARLQIDEVMQRLANQLVWAYSVVHKN